MLTLKDLSSAIYALSKAKGYAATVICTLGLTLGTLVAMLKLNYHLLRCRSRALRNKPWSPTALAGRPLTER